MVKKIRWDIATFYKACEAVNVHLSSFIYSIIFLLHHKPQK